MNIFIGFVLVLIGCALGIGIVALMSANDMDDKDRNK